MIEREMEDLLWQHTEKLLNEPLKQFRRQARSSIGRSDLVFTDRLGRLLVIEIKRGKLERQAIDQLHDYYGSLKKEFPDQPVELMAIAHSIPDERKIACERLNIEPREISEKRFRDVASEVGYDFLSERTKDSVESNGGPTKGEKKAVTETAGSGWSFGGSQSHTTGSEDDFLARCDASGKAFFSLLFERQKKLSRKTRITWNHESGFSMQFYFQRLGFIEMVWGFPPVNREGKRSQSGQSLVFPFDFAVRHQVPTDFINEFADALGAVSRPSRAVPKRPRILVEGVDAALRKNS